MADSQTQAEEISRQGKDLKYLDFVYLAAIKAAVLLAALYQFAKDNSGPLKPGVRSVEGSVKTIVGPVYEKYRGVPFEVLNFADRKVGEILTEVDRHVPKVLKSVSTRACTVAQKAPEVARSLASEVHRSGMVATATGVARDVYRRYEPVAQEAYVQYEPVAEGYAVAAWRSLNRLPLVPQVAQLIVPTCKHWAERYNRAVAGARQRGYTVGQYLPTVPIERIAKVFGEEAEKSSDSSSDSQPPTAADTATAATE